MPEVNPSTTPKYVFPDYLNFCVLSISLAEERTPGILLATHLFL